MEPPQQSSGRRLGLLGMQPLAARAPIEPQQQSSARRLGLLGMQPPAWHDTAPWRGPQLVLPPVRMTPRVVAPPAHMVRPGAKATPRVVPPRVQDAGKEHGPPIGAPRKQWLEGARQAHRDIALEAARTQARSAADWAIAQQQLDEQQQLLDDAASDEEYAAMMADAAGGDCEAELAADGYDDAGGYDEAGDEELGDCEAELAAYDDECELAAGETRHWHGQPCDYTEWDAAHEAWKASEPAAHETLEASEPYEQEVIGKPMRARDRRGSVTRGGRHVQAKRKADMLGECGIKLFMAYQCAEQHALDEGLPSRTFVDWQRDNRAGRNVGSSAATTWFGDATNYTWGSSSSSSATNYTCGGSSSSSAGRATKRRRGE